MISGQRVLRLKTFCNQLLQVPQNRTWVQQTVAMSSNNDDVLFKDSGSTRIMTLNRPKALNALNLSMVEKMIPKIKGWVDSGNVSMILIKGAGEKAFCAGGDIKAITDEGRNDPTSMKATHFFRREYILNNLIGTCPIPYVALIDGITMGGGVGLSVHAPFRIASEKTVFAMPETAIGLFPDVGGGYFLPRLQGSLGPYLALTGHRLKGEDVFRAGVATHFVQKENGSSISDKPFSLAPHQEKINKIFSADTMEDIFEQLQSDGSDWALQTLRTLEKMCPTSMKVALEQLRRGKSLSLTECLKMELRIGRTIMTQKDFYEGVRAVLVDKDNKPSWNPDTLEGVTSQYLQTFFDPMPEGCELEV